MIALTSFSDYARKSDVFENELMKYFLCELHGHDPLNSCKRKKFEDLESTSLAFLGSILAAMLPVVNLIFTVSIQDVKNKCGVLRRRMKSIPTSKTKNTTCSMAESKDMSLTVVKN